jgi:glucose-6-phosphate 1-dehydrogenase
MDVLGPTENVQNNLFCRIDVPGPCCLVIFGATGDLTKRKLIPSIFRLYKQKLLPSGFFVLGTGRTRMTSDEFREEMRKGTRESLSNECDDTCWKNFSTLLDYQVVDYDDSESFRKSIADFLPSREIAYKTGKNRIFYLATPPTTYEDIIINLQKSGLSKEENNKIKIVIEKPFGKDLQSARKLDDVLLNVFEENQVYRIDHYLAKETVQNILMFRFANSIFEPLWNRRYIDHVQITSAETIGIEKRAGYYENAGVLRDMFQNHMFQLLSLTTMEPPTLFNPERVRDEKAKVFQSIRPFNLDRLDEIIAIGQYDKGTCNGETAKSYREEAGVAADSQIPTYAALKINVENWRWNGVPFYLRSGKRLKSRKTEITFHFKPVPHMMFTQAMGGSIEPNTLILRIQPDEGISLEFQAKNPGARFCLNPVKLDFSYPRNIALDAYERVLLDCMEGDQMLFIREDVVDLTWSLLTPLIEKLESEKGLTFPNYSAGTEGPEAAAQLIERDGRRWRPL